MKTVGIVMLNPTSPSDRSWQSRDADAKRRHERGNVLDSQRRCKVEGSRMSGPCLGTKTLADFAEGLVDPAVRARVEQHASRCASCRKIMSALALCYTPATVSL